ncbi:MAG TPA: MFS transporter [Gaiellaceae bacterium]|nr:MFS transporter [Gaiellaceae bacterium]
MSADESRTTRVLIDAYALGSTAARGIARGLTHLLGGEERARVIVLLACVLGLAGADAATVGASATELRKGLNITNTDIGLLVSVTALVGAVATLPFGVLADRVKRTTTLGSVIFLWAGAMLWSAAVPNFHQLLLARLCLGAVVAAAGPLAASLIGDWFAASERGRIYGFVLAGELLGAGFGFAVTGDIAAVSWIGGWRAAFVVLAIPAFVLGWFVLRLREPARGGSGVLAHATNPLPPEADESRETVAQLLARERGIAPDAELLTGRDMRRASFPEAARYVLRVRTNLLLIGATACGYYFLAGVQTFGSEFMRKQYGIAQPVANLLLLGVGGGAVLGVLFGGAAGDWLLRRGRLNGRILTAVVGAAGATLLFLPALLTGSAFTALPYLVLAVLFLTLQNPAIAASQLDIMPPALWGRAESVRTFLRSIAMAVAPLLFGAVSDYVFGGGRSGLQWTFILMLVPLGASAWLLFKARLSYPQDVATAAAVAEASGYSRQIADDHW